MAPAELGEPAYVFVSVHRGADLAQREGGGGSFLRLERQQHQHECQERIIQREWRKGVVSAVKLEQKTQTYIPAFRTTKQFYMFSDY